MNTTWTKDNIIGVIFTHGKTRYKNLSITKDGVKQCYLDEQPGYTWVNTLDYVLENMNNGTWKIIEYSKEINILSKIEIY